MEDSSLHQEWLVKLQRSISEIVERSVRTTFASSMASWRVPRNVAPTDDFHAPAAATSSPTSELAISTTPAATPHVPTSVATSDSSSSGDTDIVVASPTTCSTVCLGGDTSAALVISTPAASHEVFVPAVDVHNSCDNAQADLKKKLDDVFASMAEATNQIILQTLLTWDATRDKGTSAARINPAVATAASSPTTCEPSLTLMTPTTCSTVGFFPITDVLPSTASLMAAPSAPAAWVVAPAASGAALASVNMVAAVTSAKLDVTDTKLVWLDGVSVSPPSMSRLNAHEVFVVMSEQLANSAFGSVTVKRANKELAAYPRAQPLAFQTVEDVHIIAVPYETRVVTVQLQLAGNFCLSPPPAKPPDQESFNGLHQFLFFAISDISLLTWDPGAQVSGKVYKVIPRPCVMLLGLPCASRFKKLQEVVVSQEIKCVLEDEPLDIFAVAGVNLLPWSSWELQLLLVMGIVQLCSKEVHFQPIATFFQCFGERTNHHCESVTEESTNTCVQFVLGSLIHWAGVSLQSMSIFARGSQYSCHKFRISHADGQAGMITKLQFMRVPGDGFFQDWVLLCPTIIVTLTQCCSEFLHSKIAWSNQLPSKATLRYIVTLGALSSCGASKSTDELWWPSTWMWFKTLFENKCSVLLARHKLSYNSLVPWLIYTSKRICYLIAWSLELKCSDGGIRSKQPFGAARSVVAALCPKARKLKNVALALLPPLHPSGRAVLLTEDGIEEDDDRAGSSMPWDPGSTIRHRLEGKPHVKERGLLAIPLILYGGPPLIGWVPHGRCWWKDYKCRESS